MQQTRRHDTNIDGMWENTYQVYNDQYFNQIFIFIDDEDEVYNPNLHSEEQDELEIPDGKILLNV